MKAHHHIKITYNLLFLSIVFLSVCLVGYTPTNASLVHVVTKDYINQLREAMNPQILKTMDGIDYPVVENPDQINIIINKKVTLSSDYIPNDLVVPNVKHTAGNKKMMRLEASEALEQLFSTAKIQGYTLIAASGYRSYSTQKGLYSRYVATYGKKEADTFSAKPGQSEHQLGLTMDYTSIRYGNQITGKIANTPEGKWVTHNAHRFGFIIRYPLGKEDITGYKYEPWHLRYVGIDLATSIYQSGKTMEEYYLLIDNQPKNETNRN